ncbi:MAG: four helix bundle protein [Verrucomicrobiota bacterium]
MKTRFRFEKLAVWQAARSLNILAYGVTKNFPSHELYAMTSQIRRASVSVSSNIAEGAGRNSDKDFAHYLEQAYGSLMEVASLFYLAFDEKYLSETNLEPLLGKIESLTKQIAALNRSLSVSTSKTPFARRTTPALDPRPSTLDR